MARLFASITSFQCERRCISQKLNHLATHPPIRHPQKLMLHVNPHHPPKVATNLVEDWLLCFGIRVHARLSMRVVLWEVVIMSTMASQVPPASTTIHCAVGNRISWHIRNIWRVRRRCTHEYIAAQFVWVNILKPFLPARPKTNLADVVEDDGSVMSIIRVVYMYCQRLWNWSGGAEY